MRNATIGSTAKRSSQVERHPIYWVVQHILSHIWECSSALTTFLQRGPRFVFDTNVLINYIRYNDQETYNALTVAADLGRVFISEISILELWVPQPHKILIKEQPLISLWLHASESGEIPEEILSMLIEHLIEHQLPVPNQFFVKTIRAGRRWFVLDENEQVVFIAEYSGNSLVFKSPDISRKQVEQEISILKAVCDSFDAQIIPASARAQQYAEVIIRFYRERLGKSAIPDSLIIATGMVRRAWLVTDDKKWVQVAEDIQTRALPLPRMKVIEPTRLALEEIPT